MRWGERRGGWLWVGDDGDEDGAQNVGPSVRSFAETEDAGRMYHRDCDASSFLWMSACMRAFSS